MYDLSPDWLKLLWVILPHVTTWVLAYLIFNLNHRRELSVRSKELDLRRLEARVYRIEE